MHLHDGDILDRVQPCTTDVSVTRTFPTLLEGGCPTSSASLLAQPGHSATAYVNNLLCIPW